MAFMDKNLQTIIKIKQDDMIKAFEKNNMQINFVDDFEQLHNYLSRYLCNKKTVALGGSMTLFETGVIEQIHNSDVILHDRYQEGLDREQMQEIYRKAFTSDLFITSTNALTTDGCLYNIDGNGSRVAPILYGPKQVLAVVGTNKIVDNVEEAIDRTRQIAAPLDAQRLEKNTPCTKLGKCIDCQHENRICNDFVLITGQFQKERIKVIIIQGNYGY